MTRGNVLIVDDDPALLEALRDTLTLRLPKTEVHAIDSPKRALELLKTQRFSAIISDMHMPGMTGLELLKQVQEVQPQASFILITGRGDLKLAAEAFRNGAFDFIQKPFERCQFVDLLKTGLTAARLRASINRRQSTLAKLSSLIRAHERLARPACGGKYLYFFCSRGCVERSIEPSRFPLEKIRKHYELCERTLAYNAGILSGLIENSRHHAVLRFHRVAPPSGPLWGTRD